jgi:hypothetical protein
MKFLLSVLFIALCTSSTIAQWVQKRPGDRDTIWGKTGIVQTDGSIKIDSSGIKMRRSAQPGELPAFEFPEGKDLTKRAEKIVEDLDKKVKELKEKGMANEGKDAQTAMAVADAVREIREDTKNDMQKLALPPIEIEVPQLPTRAQKLRAFYLMNKEKYNELIEFYKAHRRERENDMPLAPAPPTSDFECFTCDGEKQRQFQQASKDYACTFSQFIEKETKYIAFLIDCARVYQILTATAEPDGGSSTDPFPSGDPDATDAGNFFQECNTALICDKVIFLVNRIDMIANKAWKNYTNEGQVMALTPIILGVERQKQLLGYEGSGMLAEIGNSLSKIKNKLLDKFFSEHNYFIFCSLNFIVGLERTICLTGGCESLQTDRTFMDMTFSSNRFTLTIEAQAKIESQGTYVIVHSKVRADVKMSLIPQKVSRSAAEEMELYNKLPDTKKEELYPCGREFAADYPGAKLVFELEDIKDEGEGQIVNGEIVAKDGHFFYKSPKTFKPVVKLYIHNTCDAANTGPDSILVSSFNPAAAEVWTIPGPPTKHFESVISAVFGQKEILKINEKTQELARENMKRKADELVAKAQLLGNDMNNISEKNFRDIMSLSENFSADIMKGLMLSGHLLKVTFQNKNKLPINERIEATQLQVKPVEGLIYGYITIQLKYKG